MGEIRLGIIGAGKFGEMHIQVFKQMEREGKLKLVGVAARNRGRLEQRRIQYDVPVFNDYRELLALKPDAVSIVTPDHTHFEIAFDALNAGCHVLVEKPMDICADGCRKLMELAREKQLLLMVDFHKRLDPYHIALREQVESGKIGRPQYGYAYMEDRLEVPSVWFPNWAASSSPAWFLGSHMIDLFRWVIGRPNATRVFATGHKGKLIDLGIDTYDSINAKIEFEGGISLNLDTSWILPEKFPAIVNQGIRIVGTDGIAEVDSQNRGAEACYATSEGSHTWNLGFKLVRKDRWGNTRYSGYGYESIAELAENVAFLKNGGTLSQLDGRYGCGSDGTEVTRILCAVHESIRTGELIKM